MPSDLSRIVDVLCNDCMVRSGNRDWHFLGVQCLACLSFNTVVERVVSTATSSRGDVGGGEGL
jgi:hypothetical protein